MTKSEIEDEYFHKFVIWCTEIPPEKPVVNLIFWLDHNRPTQDNFWEWIVHEKLLK
jgi:hypothetical protein